MNHHLNYLPIYSSKIHLNYPPELFRAPTVVWPPLKVCPCGPYLPGLVRVWPGSQVHRVHCPGFRSGYRITLPYITTAFFYYTGIITVIYLFYSLE